ncbi:methyltransferase domain-containing protein [Tengunoibacter tsumagoiensis]|uniref:RNA methyltransferase n=1 Tax=Tengunoibacter tsumagoiensis TaxID=2014871 RepID=A0A402A749_9CHLR|nr:methyltransferase domain-containing protein [Tengunoibacter tsumagoiensis]GCE14967.1 RNA methyltransferase [Tengunoibacter tsumagoiensis]
MQKNNFYLGEMKRQKSINVLKDPNSKKINGGRSNHLEKKTYTLCADILVGLKDIAIDELYRKFKNRISIIPSNDAEMLYFEYKGSLKDLLSVKTIVAIYLLNKFHIPRPKALLGQQNREKMIDAIYEVLNLYPKGTFDSFRISAPGKDSSVFSRIKDAIEDDIHLPYDPNNGDLFLRIRPSILYKDSWEVFTRISPRPLATRGWRVFNMKGALNATIASAMLEMTKPNANDRFLNIMCGSGTLLIERLQRGKVQTIVGGDINKDTLLNAKRNISASGFEHEITLMRFDVCQLPFEENSFDVICADLPWGQLVGSIEENSTLYPNMLREVARIATYKARFVLITHNVQLFENILPSFVDSWTLVECLKVYQGGLHPRIYSLERK